MPFIWNLNHDEEGLRFITRNITHLSTVVCFLSRYKIEFIGGWKIVTFVNYCVLSGSTVVKVLCYKSEGRWFDSRWCHWNISLT